MDESVFCLRRKIGKRLNVKKQARAHMVNPSISEDELRNIISASTHILEVHQIHLREQVKYMREQRRARHRAHYSPSQSQLDRGDCFKELPHFRLVVCERASEW